MLLTHSRIKFGRLGDLIRTGAYYVPEEIRYSREDVGPDADPIRRKVIEVNVVEREKSIIKMIENRPALYAMMWGILQVDGEEAVRRTTGFDEAEAHMDPLLLWKIIKETHANGVVSSDASLVKHQTRKNMREIRQHGHESLAEFKQRRDAAKRAFLAAGNVDQDDIDDAHDFMSALDDNRYAKFKCDILNNKASDQDSFPQDVQEMYLRASSYLVVSERSSGGMLRTAFLTNADHRPARKAGGGRTGDPRGGRGRGRDSQGEGRGGGRGAGRGGGRGAGRAGRGNDNNSGDQGGASKKDKAPAKASKGKPSNGETRECYDCGEVGHISPNCPYRDDKNGKSDAQDDEWEVDNFNMTSLSKFNFVTVQLRVLASAGVKIPWYIIILDNAANNSVFRCKEILREVRSHSGIEINGIGGDVMTCRLTGVFAKLFPVTINPNAIANVLSQDEAERSFEVEYLQGVHYRIHTPRGVLQFTKDRYGLYSLDVRTLNLVDAVLLSPTLTQQPSTTLLTKHAYTTAEVALGQRAIALLSHADSEKYQTVLRRSRNISLVTVAENQGFYTKRQIIAADKAMELIKALAHPTQRDAIKLVEGSNLSNCDVTGEDIARAFHIYGGDVSALKGKMKNTPAKRNTAGALPQLHKPTQVLSSDPTHIDGHHFLFSVALPLNLVLVTPIVDEKETTLGPALLSQFGILRERGYIVTKVRTDPAKALANLKGKFSDIIIDTAGAGDHVVEAENRWKTFKERVRAVRADLPFTVPEARITDLVRYVASRFNLNLSTTTNDGISARVRFLERKVDVQRELGLCFGDYVEVRDPAAKSADTKDYRCESCIALYPTGNDNDSWEFLNLDTNLVVRRSKWTKLPMPPLIIATLNQLAQGRVKSSVNAVTTVAAPVGAAGVIQALPPTLEIPINPPRLAGVTETINDHDDEDVEEDVDNLAGVSDSDETSSSSTDEVPVDARSRRAAAAQCDTNRAKLVKARVIAGVRTRNYNFHMSVKTGLRTHGNAAVISLKQELENLLKKETLNPVLMKDLSKTQRKKVIRSVVFLKEKFDSRGVFEKLKARLVANGKQQVREDIPNRESPTVSTTNLFIMLCVAVREGRLGSTHDIGAAFLNAKMSGENVFVKLDRIMTKMLCMIKPEYSAFVNEKGEMIAKLDKALYGCVQSAKLWYDLLVKVLKEDGYVVNIEDPCVLNKIVYGTQSTILIHVDDLLCLCANAKAHEELAELLKRRFHETKFNSETILSYLGMTLDLSVAGKIKVTMEGFVHDLLAENPSDGCARSPATNSLFSEQEADELQELTALKKFHSLAAKLLYLSKRIRPDIATAVAYLVTRVTRGTVRDVVKLQRVINYLSGTADAGLEFVAGNPKKRMVLEAYMDAAFAGHDDGKSHSGFVLKFGGSVVLVRSTKQKINSTSSTEAELISLSDNLIYALRAREFIVAQGYRVGPIRVYQDNMSVLAMLKRPDNAKDRSKNMKVRRIAVKELIISGDIVVYYVPTDQMIADVLTKPLQGVKFDKMRSNILRGRMLNHGGVSRERTRE